jgi:ABC-type bacteriocin/lantibiotic exporter with double-glycine peptidase domain
MPSSWRSVPHFQQELEYSCVPACLRMVLAHHGDTRAEADLRLLLDTKPTGTRAGNILRLSGDAFEIHVRSSNLTDLQKALSDNQPPIIFLKTGSLDYWKLDIFHAVVLVGLDSQAAAFNDPYFATSPQTTSLQNFEKAWAQTGQFTAFLRRR